MSVDVVMQRVFTALLAKDPAAHLAFLASLLSRIDKKKSAEAYVLLLSTLAHAKLLYGDLLGTKADMDEAGKVCQTLQHHAIHVLIIP